MASISNMSEGGNEPQEDITSEEPAQPERDHQQVQRNQDASEVHSNRTQSSYRPTLSIEEIGALLQAGLDESIRNLPPALRALYESDPDAYFDLGREWTERARARQSGAPPSYPSTSGQRSDLSSVREPINSGRGLIPAPPARPRAPYLSVSEQRYDLYSYREPLNPPPARGPIPYPPTGPPPPYPYNEEAERIRLARGPNPSGETPARRFWNRLVRPGRWALPVNEVPRLTGQHPRGTSGTSYISDNRDPPPYSRFEPSEEDRRDDNPFYSEEFTLLFRLWPDGHPPENVHPAEAQNLADNEHDSAFNQNYQFVSRVQLPQYREPGTEALEELQGDPELPPYTPSEEIGHEDLEEDPWDGQDPWDYYMAAIEAGQNPPDGREPYMPDLGQVHDEWLRMIQRNRRGVNRAAP